MKRRDVEAVADELARRWVAGETFVSLGAEYKCHWQVVRRYVLMRLSPDVYDAARKSHFQEQGRRCPTQFKVGGPAPRTAYKPGVLRGAAARRHVAVGTIRLRTVRNNRGRLVPRYYAIKYRDLPYGGGGNWKPVAVYVWEAAHGPVPDGHYIVHRDGNRMNHHMDNLKMVSKSEMPAHARMVRPKRFSRDAISVVSRRVWRDRKLLMEAKKTA